MLPGRVGPMRRRTLLALIGAGGLSASGCGFQDPTVKGSPAPPYTPPPPTPLPEAADIVALESAAETALLAAAATPGTVADTLRRLAGVRGTHRAVLGAPDPLWRRLPATPPPTVTAGAAVSKEAALAVATTSLAALKQATTAKAEAAEGHLAALWGSLAASAEQAAATLSVPIGPVIVGIPGRVPLVMSNQEAYGLVVERYHETVFGMSSLLGFLPVAHPLRPMITSLLLASRTRRDSLVAYGRASSATPDPGAGAYSVPPATADRVPGVAASLLASITTAAGVWVASAPKEHRPRAVAELAYAATAAVPLGAGIAEWPGWPDQP